ncbi:MAG: PaaI family thioesterase [Candidatus Nanopelagicales bacterium]
MTKVPAIEGGIDPGALGARMGMRILEARPGRVVATMPVEGNTQPYGLLHGGASAVLAESVGSIAAWLHGGPDSTPVGLDLSCTHHRAVRSGTVTAVATPLAEGRTVASYDIRITDDQGRPVCTARLTCLIRGRRAPGVAANDP